MKMCFCIADIVYVILVAVVYKSKNNKFTSLWFNPITWNARTQIGWDDVSRYTRRPINEFLKAEKGIWTRRSNWSKGKQARLQRKYTIVDDKTNENVALNHRSCCLFLVILSHVFFRVYVQAFEAYVFTVQYTFSKENEWIFHVTVMILVKTCTHDYVLLVSN